jgi:hypothetical protein
MLLAIIAARWTVLRLNLPSAPSPRLVMGGIAPVFLLAAEFGFASWVRGLSIRDYLATRDPVSGTAYYVALGLFAMPLFAGNKALSLSNHSKIQTK